METLLIVAVVIASFIVAFWAIRAVLIGSLAQGGQPSPGSDGRGDSSPGYASDSGYDSGGGSGGGGDGGGE